MAAHFCFAYNNSPLGSIYISTRYDDETNSHS